MGVLILVKGLVDNASIFVEVLEKGVVFEAGVEDDTNDGGLDGELEPTDVAVSSLLAVVNGDGGPSRHKSV